MTEIVVEGRCWGSDMLSERQCELLRCLGDWMIPADESFDVPGAGDERIFSDVLKSRKRNEAEFDEVAQKLEGLLGGRPQDLTAADKDDVVVRLQADAPAAFKSVARVILQCYYRDDRVMRSLGMEVRPPFPGGFEVERGDWSLLEPVKARPPFYRQAP